MRIWTQGSGLRTHGAVKINTGESEEVLMSDHNVQIFLDLNDMRSNNSGTVLK